MKRDDTKKNFTALSGNDLKTVHPHYLSFPCFIAFVTISEVFCLMRYGSVQNAEIYLFCSENRNFYTKEFVCKLFNGKCSVLFCCYTLGISLCAYKRSRAIRAIREIQCIIKHKLIICICFI